MNRTFVIIALMLLIIGPAEACSEELGRAVFEGDILGSGFCDGAERIQIVLLGGCRFSPDFGPICCECSLWPGTWLTTADVGTTLTATAATASCFSILVQTLTNDVSQMFGVQRWIESGYQSGLVGCGSNSFGWEDQSFSLDSNDFYGATITSFAVRLDSLSFRTGFNPQMIDAYVRLTWIVEGMWNNTAIEPSSWSRIKALFSE